jgi:hypothetical protein
MYKILYFSPAAVDGPSNSRLVTTAQTGLPASIVIGGSPAGLLIAVRSSSNLRKPQARQINAGYWLIGHRVSPLRCEIRKK